MSADDGIYIHKFKKGWKVAHAQAIENIYYWKEGDKWVKREEQNPDVLANYFNDSKWFITKDEALKYAIKLEKDIGWIEYGISEI